MDDMGREVLQPLRVGDDAILYVNALPLTDATEATEVEVSGRAPTSRQVLKVIRRFAEELTEELGGTDATKVTVEFGCEIAVESGTVFAVLGKASTKSALKVVLEWDRPRN